MKRNLLPLAIIVVVVGGIFAVIITSAYARDAYDDHRCAAIFGVAHTLADTIRVSDVDEPCNRRRVRSAAVPQPEEPRP